MALAARLPGAPDIVARFAARMLVSAKSPQQAVVLLAKVYEETTDEDVRKLLEQRLREAIVERDLDRLEKAVSRFQAQYAERPARLEELLEKGVLQELPTEPFGGLYLYDPETGVVRSSEVQGRMQLTIRKRGQYH